MKRTIKSITITLAIAGYTFAACDAFAATELVKKSDLPALKGGKSKAEPSPIPTCFDGNRAKMPMSDELLTEWRATHAKHECAGASTVYVCRAGKNLSVRCE